MVGRRLKGYALLFAIPVDREEFGMAMRGEIYSDYSTELRASGDTDAAWAQSYGAVAAAIGELIATARALGVTIIARATLADIATATSSANTVIFMGHFRGWSIRPADFAGHAAQVLARFRNGDPLLPLDQVPIVTIEGVAQALNDAIEFNRLECLVSPVIRDATRSAPLLRFTLQRDVVDEALDGLIAPGNLIELADGLHTPGAFEAAMAPSFHGELDLSMCNSKVLAMLIDIRRKGAVRHAYFETEILPLPHVLTIRESLRIVAEQGGSYLDARIRLHHSLGRLAATYTI